MSWAPQTARDRGNFLSFLNLKESDPSWCRGLTDLGWSIGVRTLKCWLQECWKGEGHFYPILTKFLKMFQIYSIRPLKAIWKDYMWGEFYWLVIGQIQDIILLIQSVILLIKSVILLVQSVILLVQSVILLVQSVIVLVLSVILLVQSGILLIQSGILLIQSVTLLIQSVILLIQSVILLIKSVCLLIQSVNPSNPVCYSTNPGYYSTDPVCYSTNPVCYSSNLEPISQEVWKWSIISWLSIKWAIIPIRRGH